MKKTSRSTERRACPRLRQRVRILLLTDDCALGEPYRGVILDSSRGGLRLIVPRQEISAGSLLRIRHAQAWDGVPWLPVQVVNSRLVNDQWELGCQRVILPAI